MCKWGCTNRPLEHTKIASCPVWSSSFDSSGFIIKYTEGINFCPLLVRKSWLAISFIDCKMRNVWSTAGTPRSIFALSSWKIIVDTLANNEANCFAYLTDARQ
jgi:hypothetical protein